MVPLIFVLQCLRQTELSIHPPIQRLIIFNYHTVDAAVNKVEITLSSSSRSRVIDGYLVNWMFNGS